MKRIPVLPTLLVLVAVGIMIRLGFWQLGRLHEKESMISRYAAAQQSQAEVKFPAIPPEEEDALYHRSKLGCMAVGSPTSMAGRNGYGEVGFAHVFTCQDGEGSTYPVIIGWSRNPASPAWRGGKVTGWIAPGPKLVADPPVAGLEPNAKPDPNDIPNNHLSYAVQWFLFALTALVIYIIALRKRLRG